MVDVLKWTWKEVVVINFMVHPSNRLGRLKKTTRSLHQDSRWNQTSPEYNSEALKPELTCSLKLDGFWGCRSSFFFVFLLLNPIFICKL
jgi:hypothetical protein